MQLNNIKRDNPNKDSKRVGRGGKRGKTSGAGMKGQKARTGNSTRPELRDIIKKIPKLRGHGVNGNKNKSIINKYFAINLFQINEAFSDGDVVNAKTLHSKGVADMKKGRIVRVKVLANGNIEKKVTIEGLLISESAKQKVEEAGGIIK
jgi:large subunit ribosomal protein L15